MRFIDCASHALTGPAILHQCGMLPGGRFAGLNQWGRLDPVCLILPRGSVEQKILAMRVAATKHGESTRGRFFSLEFSAPINAFFDRSGVQVPVSYVILRFGAGTLAMQVGAALLATAIKKGNDE